MKWKSEEKKNEEEIRAGSTANKIHMQISIRLDTIIPAEQILRIRHPHIRDTKKKSRKKNRTMRKNGEIKSENSFRTSVVGRFDLVVIIAFKIKKKKDSHSKQVKIYGWFYDCYYCFRHLRHKDYSCVFQSPHTNTNTNTRTVLFSLTKTH